MKKRLHRIYLLSIAAVMLMALLAIALMIKVKIDDTRLNLRTILNTSAALTLDTRDNFQTIAESIARSAPPIRATFLLNNGIVLADSDADALSLGIHINRPEIKAALEGGIGESLRISDAKSELALYAAMRLSDLLILRLSYPLTDTLYLAGAYGLVLLAMFILIYILQRRAMSRFAVSVIGQVERIRLLLDGNEEEVGAVFPEFGPVMDQIAYQVHRLHEDLDEVSRTLNLRQNFVANASHELRSPLTSIMGFAEMIDEGLADTPQERELCVKMIRSECDRMLEVIQDILLLSRAEDQPAQALETVDVETLAREICQSLELQAGEKNIRLEVSGSMSIEAVEKDVWEIVYNLVQNGVRYGREGGRVDVLLSPGRISVRDDGVGIAKEHLPHLFEQFYRVDETRGMASGGTGLGLSIVRALVERHGGTIQVTSTLGEGSEFVVTFDKAAKEGR